MTEQQKKEFTRRITTSNSTGLILVLYDITLVYIEDGLAKFDTDPAACERELKRANHCISEMIANLHFEVELAKNFHQIYLSMKKSLREGFYKEDKKKIEAVRDNLVTLRDAYEKIADQDKGKPVMMHAEKVVAGLTYGRTDINENLAEDSGKRGYLV